MVDIKNKGIPDRGEARAPRIALISGSYVPDRCGVADYTRRLAQALAAEGLEPFIVTSKRSLSGIMSTNGGPLPAMVKQSSGRGGCPGTTSGDGYQETSLPVHRLVPDWRLASLSGLVKKMLELSPDVVHIQHSASSFGHKRSIGLLPLLMKVRCPSLPIVVTAHEYGGWRITPPVALTPIIDALGSWFERRGLADREDLFLLSLSRVIIVTNQYHFEYVKGHVPGVGHKLRLVPIGPNVLSVAEGREQVRRRVLTQLGLPPSANLVCYFGFLHPVKGLELLLRAFKQVAAGNDEAHLVVIGGMQSLSLSQEEAESYCQRLTDLRDELGLSRSVTFTGYVDSERVSELLLASDVCVLPFNHGASLKSGSLLAALAHGLPVLTTRTEATTDELKDGENVLLVPPRNPAALAAGLERLLTSEALRARLAQGARALSSRFSWKRIADEHINLYSTLLPKRIVAD